MSNDVKVSLKTIGIAIGVLAAAAPVIVYLAALIGLPERVSVVEKQQAAMREVLIRIDENVKALKEAQQKR